MLKCIVILEPAPEIFPPTKTRADLLAKTRQLVNQFNDKAWPYQWYLNQGGKGSNGLDMNVDEAWTEGYTGIFSNTFENFTKAWRVQVFAQFRT